MTAPQPRGARYELTVRGELGPALRRILDPCTVGSCELHTVMRVVVPLDRDLVDLVEVLRSRELEITEILHIA